jgi:hypothetical protein
MDTAKMQCPFFFVCLKEIIITLTDNNSPRFRNVKT